jgi:hypothetical protein
MVSAGGKSTTTAVVGMIAGVSDLEQLMDLARTASRQVIARAGECMLAGAKMTRIHRRYVVPAVELLEEAETQAVLAAADDRNAIAAIERVIAQLDGLSVALEEEYPS